MAAFDFNNKDLDASLSTTPISISEGAHPPYITVEIYENQRWLPLSKWTGRRRLPTDRPLYSNKSGTEELSFTNFRLPPGYVFGSPPNSPSHASTNNTDGGATRTRQRDTTDDNESGDDHHKSLDNTSSGQGGVEGEQRRSHLLGDHSTGEVEIEPPSAAEVEHASSTAAAHTSFPAAATQKALRANEVRSPATPIDVIANDWQIEISDRTDREGWRYAVDYKAHFDKEMHSTSLVRRRRYFRTAVYTGGRGVEGAFGFSREGESHTNTNTYNGGARKSIEVASGGNSDNSAAEAFFSSSGVGAVVRDVGFVHVSKTPAGAVFAQSGAETIHENIVKKYNQNNRVIGNERTEPIDPFDIPYHQIPRGLQKGGDGGKEQGQKTYASAASGFSSSSNTDYNTHSQVNWSENANSSNNKNIYISSKTSGTAGSMSPDDRTRVHVGIDVSDETRRRLQHEASVAALAAMKREEEEQERQKQQQQARQRATQNECAAAAQNGGDFDLPTSFKKGSENTNKDTVIAFGDEKPFDNEEHASGTATAALPRNPFFDDGNSAIHNHHQQPSTDLGPTGTNYESYKSAGRASVVVASSAFGNPFLESSSPAAAAAPLAHHNESFNIPDVPLMALSKQHREGENEDKPKTANDNSNSNKETHNPFFFSSKKSESITNTVNDKDKENGDLLFTSQSGTFVVPSPSRPSANFHNNNSAAVTTTSAGAATDADVNFGLQQDTSAARFDAVFSAFVAKEEN